MQPEEFNKIRPQHAKEDEEETWFCRVKLQYLTAMCVDPELSSEAYRAISCIALIWADKETGEAHPSLVTIGNAIGRSAAAVKAALRQEAARRYIEVVHRGTNRGDPSRYRPDKQAFRAAIEQSRAQKSKKPRQSSVAKSPLGSVVEASTDREGGRGKSPSSVDEITKRGQFGEQKGGRPRTPNLDQELKLSNGSVLASKIHTDRTDNERLRNVTLDIENDIAFVEAAADRVMAHISEIWPKRSLVRDLDTCRETVVRLIRQGTLADDLIAAAKNYRADVEGRTGKYRTAIFRSDRWLITDEWKRYLPMRTPQAAPPYDGRARLERLARKISSGVSIPSSMCSTKDCLDMLEQGLATPDQIRAGVEGGPDREDLMHLGWPIEEDR